MSVSFQAFQRKGERLFAAQVANEAATATIAVVLVPLALMVTGPAVILVRLQVPAFPTAALETGRTGMAASAAIVFIPT